MPILNYTTTIAAGKTVAEVQTILANVGCRRVLIEYEQSEPSALMFELQAHQYRLPCREEAVYKKLLKDQKVPGRLRTHAQARRVAWRILKDWVEAQTALISVGMVSPAEVFLPYQITASGETVYEVYARSDNLLEAKR